MVRQVVLAYRRAFAALVVVGTFLAAGWAFQFKDWYSIAAIAIPLGAHVHLDCSLGPCSSTQPGWTIPAAVAIALVGSAAAIALHKPRWIRQ